MLVLFVSATVAARPRLFRPTSNPGFCRLGNRFRRSNGRSRIRVADPQRDQQAQLGDYEGGDERVAEGAEHRVQPGGLGHHRFQPTESLLGSDGQDGGGQRNSHGRGYLTCGREHRRRTGHRCRTHLREGRSLQRDHRQRHADAHREHPDRGRHSAIGR
ncbi:hypothetical protein [Saccharopolyspora shandongensis]|uniref:hypothetical protein n=1 Tax=Saccharopolyspora shandongensis TaxID=418495 RepID=UPI00115FFCC6|nr:hypothetical protein [Saccharopolyspora shandongensis]